MSAQVQLISKVRPNLGRIRFRAERSCIMVKLYPGCKRSREMLARVKADFVEFPYLLALIKHGYKVVVTGQPLCLASELISYDQFDEFMLAL